MDITWTQLRAATDPAFAQEMRRRDGEESRRIGLRLKALREDRNLSQRDLARLVGMSAPQLSKVESGTFDLRVSTVQTILRAMGASFAEIAGPDVPELSQRELRRRAERVGAPSDLLERLLSFTPRRLTMKVLEKAFGWTRDDLIADRLTLRELPAGLRFKAMRKQTPTESPVVGLGYTISQLVRENVAIAAFRGVPEDPEQLRSQASEPNGEVTFASLLRWTWGAGIAVIPLYGRGGFSAAVWTVGSAPVVVLKETREFAAFWLFDLAHELGHIASGHGAEDGVIDVESPHPHAGSDADEEDANTFALRLLLPRHEQLLEEVRREARGSHLRFKGAVVTVARRAKVSPGVLGMIAAYELTEVGQYKDRWGSATNLARPDGSGREVAERLIREHLSAERLSEVDAALVGSLVTDLRLQPDDH